MRDVNFNVHKFCKKQISLTDDDIPKYVSFLIREKDKERLVKILHTDYFDIYPNENKSVSDVLFLIDKLCYYFMILASILLFTLGIASSFLAVMIVLQRVFTPQFVMDNMNISLLGITFIPISIWLMKIYSKTNGDRYTCKTEHIKKLIDKKVKKFDKDHLNYFS